MTNSIFRFYVRLMMFVLPIVYLPVVADPFGSGKNWLLMVLAVLGLLLWTVDMVFGKKKEVKTNAFLPWFLALVVWAWIGWWVRLPVGVRMRSVVDMGGVGTLTAMFLWFFIWLQTESKEERRAQINFLTVGGVVTALASIIVFLIPAAKMPISWPKDNPIITLNQQWSLAGSILSEALIVLFLAIEWGRRLVRKLREEGGYIMEAVMTSFLSLGTLLSVFRIFKTGFVNLDGSTAWVVAAEVFKRSPIWGAGIGDFMEAFSAFRPMTYNLTQYWASGFKYSSMGVLQLWTELGLVGLGLAAIMLLIFVRQKKNFKFVRNAIMVAAVMFLPFNIAGVILLTWLLATAIVQTIKVPVEFKVGSKALNIAPLIVGVLVVGASVFSGFWFYRILMGEMTLRQSLVAASKNDGGTTYNLQIRAIGMMPELAEYRRIYSQTNLALATTLLSNKDLTDDDKQKASVLIQQSVREGKAAISLEPNNPGYWLNLASIYRQIVGVVDGAADWSFQAYQQAVALEPANPVSKLEMGGILFAANRFDEADRVFEQVVVTKNDFANGWYNWAYSAKRMNKLGDAVARLNQAVALVPADSGDFEKASQELAEWKKELDELTKKVSEQQKQPETLTAPQPLPTVNPAEKVNVPTGELAPQITPLPTATRAPASPTAVPTMSP